MMGDPRARPFPDLSRFEALNGATVAEVATRLGLSQEVVLQVEAAHPGRLTFRRCRTRGDAQIDKRALVQGWLSGRSGSEMAQAFGVTPNAVSCAAGRLRLPRRLHAKGRPIVDQSPEALAKALPVLLRYGATPDLIARAYNRQLREIEALIALRDISAPAPVKPPRVIRVAPLPARRVREPQCLAPDTAPARPPGLPEVCDAEILALLGKRSVYRRLSQIARDYGLPLARVTARFHALRAAA